MRMPNRLLRCAAMLLLAWTGAAGAADATLARGAYLARLGDCASCHTAQGGPAFAGGRLIRTPFGDIATPNLTPDRATGLGAWSAEDFYRAMHEGVGRDGQALYPAFPYTSYTRLSRADVEAIYRYLQSLAPVSRTDAGTQLRFPYRLRPLLAFWRTFFFAEGEYQPDPAHPAQWNRGAYLVQGAGHCNECHGARNAFGALSGPFLGGGLIPVQDWYAPDLATSPNGGLAGWNEADIVQLLKTGSARHGVALGPMAEVVEASTQYASDEDLAAIAAYLASLPSRPAAAPVPALASDAPALAAGKAVYARQCAGCHGDDGLGKPGKYPALRGNTTVLEATGINATRAVMLGGFAPSTAANGQRPYSMPPFAQRLSDAEAASVLSYVRQTWGNRAAPVGEDDVRARRTVPAY